MFVRISIVPIALASAVGMAIAGAAAEEHAKYPDWKGQWIRIGGGQYDPTKPGGVGQKPPLTPEYQAIWEARIAAEATGSQNYNPQARCLPGGMPRMMIVYEPMEIVITPEVTYIMSGISEPAAPHLHGRP